MYDRRFVFTYRPASICIVFCLLIALQFQLKSPSTYYPSLHPTLTLSSYQSITDHAKTQTTPQHLHPQNLNQPPNLPPASALLPARTLPPYRFPPPPYPACTNRSVISQTPLRLHQPNVTLHQNLKCQTCPRRQWGGKRGWFTSLARAVSKRGVQGRRDVG